MKGDKSKTRKMDSQSLLNLSNSVEQLHCLSVPYGTLGKAAKHLHLLDCKQRLKSHDPELGYSILLSL